MKWKTFKALYHVGTLDPAHKGVQGRSLEGHGLSVSECPDAWKSIARLGGHPTWRLTKEDNRFLDAHRLSKAERREIEEYGRREGWVETTQIWAATWFDSEMEDWATMYCKDEREARAQVDYLDEDERRVEQKEVLGGGGKLASYVGFMPDPAIVPGLLLVAYADHVLHWDGVFWNDELDVYGLSAPRAVILPERLPEWRIERVE